MTNSLQLTRSRGSLAPHGSATVVRVAVTAPTQQDAAEHRLPLDLAVAIDVSGSMEGTKIEQAKQAAQRLVSRLTADDTCSLVTFAHHSMVVHTSTPMNAGGRALLHADITRLQAGGGTALHAGWNDAVQTILPREAGRGSLRRVFLLTDGQANEGISDPATLASMAATAQHNGVTTSTFGLGLDYNEHLLSVMASAGEGNTYYIQEPVQIDESFGQELAQLFTSTLRDVVVSVTIPAGVDATVVGDRNHRRAGQEIQFPLASLVSGETRDVYLLLQSTGAAPVDSATCVATLTGIGADGTVVNAMQALTLGEPADAGAVDETLERRAAEIDAAAALAAALVLLAQVGRAAALVAIDARAERFPLFARYGLYEKEKAALPRADDADGMKRRAMRSKDMVNSTPRSLEKYQIALDNAIRAGEPAAFIARLQEDIAAIKQRHGIE